MNAQDVFDRIITAQPFPHPALLVGKGDPPARRERRGPEQGQSEGVQPSHLTRDRRATVV